MKRFTIFPLAGYNTKVLSVIMSGITLLLYIMISFSKDLLLISNLSLEQNRNLLFWAFNVFLVGICFSKEKHEDERISALRDKSFFMAFGYLIITVLSFRFTSIFFKDSIKINIGEGFETIAIIGTLFYLLIFNLGIYTKASEYYGNNKFIENIKFNSRFYLIYAIIVAILLILSFIYS